MKTTKLTIGIAAALVLLIGFVFDVSSEGVFSEAIARFMTILIAIFTGLLMVHTYKLAEQHKIGNSLKQTSNEIELAKIKIEKQLRAEKKEETRKHNIGIAIGLIEERSVNVSRKMREFSQNQSTYFKQWLDDNQNDNGMIAKSEFQNMLKKTDKEYWDFFKAVSKEEDTCMRAEYSKRTGKQWRGSSNL